jgi:uncharacterized protein YbcV (DUF1398 family)
MSLSGFIPSKFRSNDQKSRYSCDYRRGVFTIEQIEDLHDRLGSADTLPDYVQSLAALGVLSYSSFVCNGHSEYLGTDGQRVVSGAAHDLLAIAHESDRDKFLDHLGRQERSETSYVEMSSGLAESGVEGWTVDTHSMTMTVYDRSGNVLLVRQIM